MLQNLIKLSFEVSTFGAYDHCVENASVVISFPWCMPKVHARRRRVFERHSFGFSFPYGKEPFGEEGFTHFGLDAEDFSSSEEGFAFSYRKGF